MRLENNAIICDKCKKQISRWERRTCVVNETVSTDDYYTKDICIDRIHLCATCYSKVILFIKGE